MRRVLKGGDEREKKIERGRRRDMRVLALEIH
jgi:hypothetical protein